VIVTDVKGREPESKILEEMVAEAPGPINFTMFLGLFGDRLKGNSFTVFVITIILHISVSFVFYSLCVIVDVV